MRYRRNYVPGGTYFFTVNLLERDKCLLVEYIEALRHAVAKVKSRRPFVIDAWVVLPDHMHAVWTLPADDADYSGRWREIKKAFCKLIPPTEYTSSIRRAKGERGIWQRRFCEHTIANEADYTHHINYVYFNPKKHGIVAQVKDWPYSSFHRDVQLGLFDANWCGAPMDQTL